MVTPLQSNNNLVFSSSGTCAFTSSVTAGSTIIVVTQGDAPCTGVSDNKGNTYVKDASLVGAFGNVDQDVWRSVGTGSGVVAGSTTVTFSSPGATGVTIQVVEVPAVLSKDNTGTGFATAGTHAVTSSWTVAANTFAIAYCKCGGTYSSADSGWTKFGATDGGGSVVIYENFTSGGSVTAGVTQSSGYWGVLAVSYTSSGGAPSLTTIVSIDDPPRRSPAVRSSGQRLAQMGDASAQVFDPLQVASLATWLDRDDLPARGRAVPAPRPDNTPPLTLAAAAVVLASFFDQSTPAHAAPPPRAVADSFVAAPLTFGRSVDFGGDLPARSKPAAGRIPANEQVFDQAVLGPSKWVPGWDAPAVRGYVPSRQVINDPVLDQAVLGPSPWVPAWDAPAVRDSAAIRQPSNDLVYGQAMLGPSPWLEFGAAPSRGITPRAAAADSFVSSPLAFGRSIDWGNDPQRPILTRSGPGNDLPLAQIANPAPTSWVPWDPPPARGTFKAAVVSNDTTPFTATVPPAPGSWAPWDPLPVRGSVRIKAPVNEAWSFAPTVPPGIKPWSAWDGPVARGPATSSRRPDNDAPIGARIPTSLPWFQWDVLSARPAAVSPRPDNALVGAILTLPFGWDADPIRPRAILARLPSNDAVASALAPPTLPSQGWSIDGLARGAPRLRRPDVADDIPPPLPQGLGSFGWSSDGPARPSTHVRPVPQDAPLAPTHPAVLASWISDDAPARSASAHPWRPSDEPSFHGVVVHQWIVRLDSRRTTPVNPKLGGTSPVKAKLS